MRFEKGLLTHTEIDSNLKYKSESEISIGSTLSFYTSSPPIPLFLSL